jgi:hypothetical protein
LTLDRQYCFHIIRYDLAPDEQNLFATLVVAPFNRWLIWLAISLMFFLRYMKKEEQDQDLTMLSIKVGNSYKMIDIDDICWLCL